MLARKFFLKTNAHNFNVKSVVEETSSVLIIKKFYPHNNLVYFTLSLFSTSTSAPFSIKYFTTGVWPL